MPGQICTPGNRALLVSKEEGSKGGIAGASRGMAGAREERHW